MGKQIRVTVDSEERLRRVPLESLQRFQGNFKSLRREEYEKLRDSIERYGFFVPVFCWREKILDGHQRLFVVEKEGWELEGGVPVVDIDAKTEKEAAEKLLILSSTYGKVDPQGTYEFTSEHDISLEEFDLPDLPDFDLERFKDEFYEESAGGLTEEDDVPETPEVPVSQAGDLWLLGAHRLLCGASPSDEDGARLMDGKVPQLMVTDPPYGVDYDPGWRDKLADAGDLSYSPRRTGKVINDDRSDWQSVWELHRGDVAYVWHAGLHSSTVQRSLEAADFEVRSHIVWAKAHFPISRGHYHWRHEPCWYLVRKGGSGHWQGDRKQTTIWEIGLDENVEGGHSTQKPVECMERPLRNHSGDVFDPFVGSGTTIIAAERQQRAAYALEIHPPYCDVSVSRWQDYTGQDARLEGDGRTFGEVSEERGVGVAAA